MSVVSVVWGALGGRSVPAFHLEAPGGVKALVTALGARLVSLLMPNREGRVADVVLGYAEPAEYLVPLTYEGATCGRHANRIAQSRFEIDGRPVRLPANEPPHHLHGGPEGFDRRLWEASPDTGGASVVFSRLSLDGEEGYPGALRATVA